MKKNFFKKLSFVMALAMMISVIAPASSAFAAASPALNAKSKTLLLGNEDRSEYDFNVKNKVSGASYKWASSNKKVATVDKNGYTTAVAIGTAKVSVKIVKKGKTVKTLTATVVVKDNIKELAIVAPTGADVAKLSTATDYDFNRTFKTESGSTTKTTAVTRWVVTEGATISDAGVFKADKAGKYTITAVAFQSKAKYEAWKTAGKDLKSSSVLAQKALEVTVANSIKAIKQVDPTKFTVTFDADMSKSDLSKDKVTVYQIVNGKEVSTAATKVSKLTLDATGKVATVEVSADLAADTEYKVVYGDLKGTLKTAKNALSEVAGIVFNDFAVSNSASSTSMLKYVGLVNKDGVVICYGNGKLENIDASSYLSFEYKGDVSKAAVIDKGIYLYAMDYAAEVTAKFNAYMLDSATSTYKTVTFTDTAKVTKTTPAAAVMGSAQFKIFQSKMLGNLNDSTWNTGTDKVPKGETLYIVPRYIPENQTAYTYENTVSSKFYYKSSNDSIALASGNTIYGVAEGTVTIVVYDNDYKITYGTEKVIGSFDITVTAKRVVTSITQDVTNVVLSNNTAVAETKRVTLMVKDNLGESVAISSASKYTVSPDWDNNVPAGLPADATTITKGTGIGGTKEGAIYIDVKMNGVTPGNYQVKIKVYDIDNDVTRYAVIGISVLDGTGTANYYRLESSTNTVDIYANYGKTVNAFLYGYNAKGAKCAVADPSTYTIAIKNSATAANPVATAAVFNLTNDTKQYNIPVVTLSGAATASGRAVVTYDKGDYTLTATRTADGAQYQAAFTVLSSATDMMNGVNLVNYSANPAVKTILNAVSEAFNIRIGYMPQNEVATAYQVTGIKEIVYTDGGRLNYSGVTDTYSESKSINIVSITYRVFEKVFNGSAMVPTDNYIDYKFTVNQSINIVK